MKNRFGQETGHTPQKDEIEPCERAVLDNLNYIKAHLPVANPKDLVKPMSVFQETLICVTCFDDLLEDSDGSLTSWHDDDIEALAELQ